MPFTFASLKEQIELQPTNWILGSIVVFAIAFPFGLMILQTHQSAQQSVSEANGERITNYTANIELDRSGQAVVQETLVYDYADHERSSFSRSLNKRLQTDTYTLQDRGIGFFTQSTRNGLLEPQTAFQTNSATTLKLGSADQRVTGKQTYKLGYQLGHAVTQGDGVETVRLSPTDVTLPVPIDATSVLFNGPMQPLRIDCAVKNTKTGETSPCHIYPTNTQAIRFEATRWLEPGEGMFLELDYPIGTFRSVVPLAQNPRIPLWAIIVLAHLIVAAIIVFLFGRDARGRGVVIPSEETLDDIKPYEAGALLAQWPNYASFVGMILDLVERNVIRFERFEGGEYLLFHIERVPGNHRLDAVEQAVLHRFFQYEFGDASSGEMESASFGNYSSEAKRAYSLYEKLTNKRLVSRGWYASNIWFTYLFTALIITGWTAGLYLFLKGRVNDPHLDYLQIQLVLLIPFIYFLPRLTKAGALAREKIKGLAWYIRVAEKDRIAYHEGPQSLFTRPGKLLAYAVALKLEKDWMKQFMVGYQKRRASK